MKKSFTKNIKKFESGNIIMYLSTKPLTKKVVRTKVKEYGIRIRVDTLRSIVNIASEIMDEFDEFLEDKGIDIPNNEKKQSDCPAVLYGTDYFSLREKIVNIITKRLHDKIKE